jgi:hypothetical protein
VIFLKKRNQVNITLEESAAQNVNEYCRVHGITAQELFKAGAQRLIDEDILERAADVMTIRSLREISDGLAEPIDDLLKMIEEDKRLGDEMTIDRPFMARKTA